MSKPAQHWEDTLLAADVGCVVAHRDPPETVLQSAEFAGAANMLVEVEHPTFGQHLRLRPYIAMSRSTTVAEPRPAGRAAHRCDPGELGYSAAAIVDLREEGRGLMSETEAEAEPVLVKERRGAVAVLRLNRPRPATP